MINLKETAQKELDAYFADKEKSGIRVFLASGGCSGPKLTLALDEANEGDEAFESGGYTICIEKELFAQTGSINIDMDYMGFTVESEKEIAGLGGGCSSCGGGCGG